MLLKAGGVNLGSKGLERKPPTADNHFFLCVGLKLLSSQENVGSAWTDAGIYISNTHHGIFFHQLMNSKCIMGLRI